METVTINGITISYKEGKYSFNFDWVEDSYWREIEEYVTEERKFHDFLEEWRYESVEAYEEVEEEDPQAIERLREQVKREREIPAELKPTGRKEHLYIGSKALCLHHVENNSPRENFEIIRELNEKNDKLKEELTKKNIKTDDDLFTNIYTKNYIVFAFEWYYPRWGADDIQWEFATKEEALKLVKELFISEEEYWKPQYEYFQIYSKSKWEVIYERYFDKYK